MSFNLEQQPFSAVDRMSDGLRAYFARVYNYMAGGLALSGLTAWLAVRDPFFGWFYRITPQGITYSLIGWLAILAPLILVFMISSSIGRQNANRAKGLFWLFSALMGISLSNIFLLYAQASIVQAFIATAGMFAGISLYGYTTGRSLASWGSFLMMGLFGVILASVVNIFVGSSTFAFGLSVVMVFIFVGLTAYDTQKLKFMYRENDDSLNQTTAIAGALSLYLDFINMFRLVLYFIGDRK